jgi:magnesium-transporting ATPase (P-type)
MLRSILGIILGYAVIFVFVFVTFTVAYLVMGADRAFKPGSYDVSTMWIVTSLVLGLVAAILGGWTCAAIARSGKAPKVLAGIVLVLSVLVAIPELSASKEDPPPVRTGDVSNMEAMMMVKQPPVVLLANPLVGMVGVLIGGGLRKRPASAAS